MEQMPAAGLATQSLQTEQLSRVSFDSGQSVGADFAKALDGYRSQSEAMDAQVKQTTDGGGGSNPANAQLKQLADLYTYAVQTQLVVRTSSQLTTGLRQVMSGQ